MNSLLKTTLCGVELKNPIIAASGTFGFGREYNEFFDVGVLGAISVKGLTLAPRQGNNAPRIAEVCGGILNAVGLQNPGVESFVKNELPWLKAKKIPVIANIAGNTVEEYSKMCEIISDSEVDIVELNISCPNVAQGGVAFGVDPKAIFEVVSASKKALRQPLMVKLSPNASDIGKNAASAQDAGADCLSLINTITAMAINLQTRRPILANITGGLSGPCVKPVALRMVHQAFCATKLPIVGMGGIMNGNDVAEFFVCGASAVMVGTANIFDPLSAKNILSEFEQFAKTQNITNVSQLVGTLQY